MLPYFEQNEYDDFNPSSEEEAREERARQAFFSYEKWGWCDMRVSQPYLHWLVEVKRDISDHDEQPIVMRPVSNNCVADHWGMQYFDEQNYYWRPRYFGTAPNRL